MNADKCVCCGKIIPEGTQVCMHCQDRAFEYGCPTGFITAMDIANMSGLRGWQIQRLLSDHGTRIGGRLYIKFDTFYKLRESGALAEYAANTTWSPTYLAEMRGWRSGKQG